MDPSNCRTLLQADDRKPSRLCSDMDSKTYVVRPFSKPLRADSKDVFRIHLSPATMLLHKLHAGDTCQIGISRETVRHAIAWPASEKITDSVVQSSKALQALYGLKLGDKISIVCNKVPVANADSVSLCEFYTAYIKNPSPPLKDHERLHWSWFLEYTLGKAEHISPGMLFEDVELRGEKRSFKVLNINSSNGLALFRVHSHSKIHIQGAISNGHGPSRSAPELLEVSSDGIGGLKRELEQLNKYLAAYSGEQLKMKVPAYYRRRRGGIILYGPSGTGKSMLLRQICAAPWQKVLRIDGTIVSQRSGDSNMLVRKLFEDALGCQPSVISIEDLQSIAGKRDLVEQSGVNIAAGLCEGLDRLGDARVLVVAATASLVGVDENLRRPGRFEFDIEIPVPDAPTRTEILKVASGLPKDATARELEALGDRTHGFVGADLDKLVQLAVDKAIERVSELENNERGSKVDGPFKAEPEVEIKVTETDLHNALLDVRPTAMREVFLETPKVRWSDIGGQHVVKKILKQAVEWPFKA